MGDLLFCAGLTLILCHELDAVSKREWTLLFVLRSLPEPVARVWFIGLHIPLFCLVFLSYSLPGGALLQILFSGFFVIHALIHLRLRVMKRCPFTSPFSRLFIDGPAVFGAIHLVVEVPRLLQ